MLNTKLFNIRLYLEGLKRLKVIGMAVAILSVTISALIPIVDWMNTPWDYDKIDTIQQNTICVPLYFVIIIAPFFFFVLFSFLHKRRESDFFHAIPYTRTCVYVSFVASALTFIFAIMIASSAVAGMLWGMHPFATFKVGELISVTLACMLAAAMLSGFMMLSLTLTGTPMTTTLMFLLFTLFTRLIMYYLNVAISYQVDVIDVSDIPYFGFNWFFPIGMLAFAINGTGYRYFNPINSVSCIVYSLLVTILLFTVAWFFYKRRKSEMAGNTAPNRLTQHIFRILFTLPFVLIIPTVILSNDMDFAIFLVLTVITLLVYYLYELITTKRFKGFGKATALLPILLGACFLFVIAFNCIQSVIFATTPEDPDDISGVYIDVESGYSTGWDDYQRFLLLDCNSSDRELIEIFAENMSVTLSADKRNDHRFWDGRYYMYTVKFTLKSGRTVVRNVAIKENERDKIMKKYVESIDIDEEMIWSLPPDDCIESIYGEIAVPGNDGDYQYYYSINFYDQSPAQIKAFYRTLLKEYNALSIQERTSIRSNGRYGFDPYEYKTPTFYLNLGGNFPGGGYLPGYRGNYFYIGLCVNEELMPETFEYLIGLDDDLLEKINQNKE